MPMVKILCKNQRFGHNFSYPGAKCLNCRVSQTELSSLAKRTGLPKKKNDMRTIHSREHLLAKDISEAFNEKESFAMYLGVIKRMGFDKALQVA